MPECGLTESGGQRSRLSEVGEQSPEFESQMVGKKPEEIKA